ncbi:hypothetical protein RN001_009003 [Aquatica leii]|uniref:DUF4371 domain-containing protein n=1 Tax=Aquatica leii TaxID=1421715 RepID=A0AAN7SDK4_9COLE|nr:hypothetical protein RN001_009003 [Aquatica leii]
MHINKKKAVYENLTDLTLSKISFFKYSHIIHVINEYVSYVLLVRDLGTNDSGPVSVTDKEPVTNEGNFKAILRMRMKCGDTKLLKYCENMALNATYISAKVQNDLISICGKIIQKEIVKCLNEAKVFSVLVDKTSDISGHEQLSLYFLGFVKFDNTTAQPLADTIIASLKNLDIDCNNMVGQGYDGAAVMKCAFNGVQAIIRKSFPRALFVHCSSHSLNLALCHSCNVPSIRNCIGLQQSKIF